MEQLAPLLTQAALAASAGFWFRLLPVVAYALVARFSVGVKAAAALAYLGLTFAMLLAERGLGSAQLVLAAAWLYLSAAALAVYGVSCLLERIAFSTGALAGIFALIYLAIPAIAFRNDGLGFLLTVGFDRGFAALSYCSERRSWPRQRRFADCMQFMIVDPTLVYVTRSHHVGPPGIRVRALLRVGLGFGALVAQGCIGALLPALGLALGQRALGTGSVAADLLAVLMIWTNLLVQYVGHSGVASVQIGSLALLGVCTPERYRFPLLARSPADLWRRWNIYMGLWLQRYVFLPLAVRWQRAVPRRAPRDLGKACAVIATFALCGFAHELVGYARELRAPSGAVLGFTACGLCIVLWLALARSARELAARHGLAKNRAVASAGALASITASGIALAVFGWLALPALAGGGLPLSLLEWLSP